MRSRRTWPVVILFLLVILCSQHTASDAATSFQETHSVSLSTTSVNAAMAASITSDALVEAKHILRSAYETSITQANVAHHLEAMMRSEGAYGALSFPTLVMSGPELVLPHGDPLDDETHIINPSIEPMVMIDIGCKYRGHASDVTRTFFFESATQEMKDAYSDVLAAEEAIIEAIGPGVEISDLDAIMRSHLADYYGNENVTVLTYWGHGVGRYVHEQPILYNVAGELEVDDVLAIEPGLYFEDGWAVRVEDTVLVTETGVEILSNVGKALDDVLINQTQPHVEAEITITNYAYGQTATVMITLDDSAGRNITTVDLFNGYSWAPLERDTYSQYSWSFPMNSSFSSMITYMIRVNFTNDTYYFNQVASAEAFASDSMLFEPTIQINAENLPSDYPLVWTFAQAGAKMIRLRFEVIDGGDDQLLVKDSASRVFADLKHVHDRFLWTPWIAGDEMQIHVVATEPVFLGGVGAFRFTIDMMEYIDEEIIQPTPTTTTTTTTIPPTSPSTTEPPTTTTTTPDPTTPAVDYPLAEVLTIMSGVAVVVIVLGLVASKVKGL